MTYEQPLELEPEEERTLDSIYAIEEANQFNDEYDE